MASAKKAAERPTEIHHLQVNVIILSPLFSLISKQILSSAPKIFLIRKILVQNTVLKKCYEDFLFER